MLKALLAMATGLGIGLMVIGGVWLAARAYYEMANVSYRRWVDARRWREFRRWYLATHPTDRSEDDD